MSTIIPAPKRVIRLEPMAPMRPLDLKRRFLETTQDALAFIAFVCFMAFIAALCMSIAPMPMPA